LIGNMPRRQREQENRENLYEANQPQRKGFVSSQPQLPANRKGQHLASEHRDKPACQKEAEIPGTERGVGIVAFVRIEVKTGHMPKIFKRDRLGACPRIETGRADPLTRADHYNSS
jgi:hypothetical protein